MWCFSVCGAYEAKKLLQRAFLKAMFNSPRYTINQFGYFKFCCSLKILDVMWKAPDLSADVLCILDWQGLTSPCGLGDIYTPGAMGAISALHFHTGTASRQNNN